MDKDENVKPDWNWCLKGFKVSMTDEQKKRKKKTGSYYRRDEQVEDYKYDKGEFV